MYNYNGELAESIAILLCQDMSFEDKSRIEGMPAARTMQRWMYEKEDFSSVVARARMVQAENHRIDIIKNTKKVLAGEIEPNAAGVGIKSLQWLASKANPKVYGDRQILAGDAENPLQLLAVRLDQAIAKSEALEAQEVRMIDVTPVKVNALPTDIADLL